MEQFLPFALPDIGEEETREVLECLHSGWLTTGPRTKRFEEEMAAALGEGIHALAVCSATAGLHLALEALGVGPGDEVLVPTYTFTATAEVVRYLGAHPVFVDSDEGSLNMDPLEAEAKTTSRTKAILPVHLGGLPCDMARFFDLASRRGLRIVEDAAHAYTSCWHGRPIGALDSDAAVLSFYATKTLTTGEGGMLLTRDENVARRARVMRLHGISRDAFDRYTSPKASWFYEVVAPGFKYNMMDLVAAIGIHQLRKAPLFRERREQIALRYDDLFRDLPLVLPAHVRDEGDRSSWHLYIVRLSSDAPISRDDFIQRLQERGIGTSVHYIPLHLQPYWRETYALHPEDFPRAQRAYEGAVSLPIYPRMTDADVERVGRAVCELLS